jgi:hypothetical protein
MRRGLGQGLILPVFGQSAQVVQLLFKVVQDAREFLGIYHDQGSVVDDPHVGVGQAERVLQRDLDPQLQPQPLAGGQVLG